MVKKTVFRKLKVPATKNEIRKKYHFGILNFEFGDFIKINKFVESETV
jgi:hypothetical protein